MTQNNLPDDADIDIEETFSAYIDGDLEDDASSAFEARLANDPALAAEFDDFRETIAAVQSFKVDLEPVELDPDLFVLKVENTIRKRSRGRFFYDDVFYRTRIPYEAFAIVMLVVIAALLYTLTPSTPDHNPNIVIDKIEEKNEAMGGPSDAGDTAVPPQTPKPDASGITPKNEHEQPATPDAGSGASPHDNTDTEASKNNAPVKRPVKKMRTEMAVYTINLRDANPANRAQTLAKRIRSTSRAFKVNQLPTDDGQKVIVRMEQTQLKSFLASFAKLGQVQSMRTYVESTNVAPKATVTFRISSTSAKRPRTIPPRP